MPETQNLFVKNGNTLTRVPISTIHWIEAQGRKVFIHTDTNILTSNSSISKVSDILKDTPITRFHKSYLVNIEKIENINNGQVHLRDISLNVGRTYMHNLQNIILKI